MDYVHWIITMNRKHGFFILLFFYSQWVFAFWPNVPTPPQSDETDLADEIYVNGIAERIRNFNSRLSARQVLSFYRNKWNDKFAESTSGPWQQISRMNDKYFITVQVQDKGFSGSQGKIIIAESPTNKKEVGKNISMMNGTKMLNEVITKDQYYVSTVVLLMNNFTPEENMEFYEQQYTQTDWKTVLKKNLQEQGISLAFKKENDDVTITINRTSAGTSILINKVNARSWFN